MRRTSCFALASLAVMLLFCPLAQAQEYQIHLTSDAKVGDKYRLTTTARHAEKTTMFLGNSAVNNRTDEFTTELVASVKVLETNGHRQPTKVALGVEKCMMTRGGETKSLIDAGRIVIATREGKETVFIMDNGSIDAITEQALSMVVPFDDSDFTDDEIFGTREKKKVGDSWDINAALVAKWLNDSFKIATATSNIKGIATLEGVVKTGQEEHLLVSASLNIDRFSVPLPDGFKIQDGQVKGSFSGKFPVNPARERLADSSKIAASFTADGPPEPKFQGLTIQGIIEQSATREIEYLQ